MHTSAYCSFQQIRQAKKLTSRQVADAAGVPLREEYLYEIGGIIGPESKEKLIQALSSLTSYHYVLGDFEPLPVSDETVLLSIITYPPQTKGTK